MLSFFRIFNKTGGILCTNAYEAFGSANVCRNLYTGLVANQNATKGDDTLLRKADHLNAVVNELTKLIPEVPESKINHLCKVLMESKMSLKDVRVLLLKLRHELATEPVQKWQEQVDSLQMYGFRSTGLMEMLKLHRLSQASFNFAGVYDVLQQLGLSQADIASIIAKYPSIVDQTRHLKARGYELVKIFPKADVRTLIKTTPNLLVDNWEAIINIVNYVHYNMGIEVKNAVRTSIFSKSLFDLQCRHQFLLRAGKYVTPRKANPNPPENPELKFIIDTSDSRFATKIAGLTIDEFLAFKDILQVEMKAAGDTTAPTVRGGKPLGGSSDVTDENDNDDSSNDSSSESSSSDSESSSSDSDIDSGDDDSDNLPDKSLDR